MFIYLLINSYGKGGAESANVHLANGLSSLGVTVHLLILKGTSKPYGMDERVIVHTLNLDGVSARHVCSSKHPAVRKVEGVIAKTRADLSAGNSFVVIASLPLANKISFFLDPLKVFYWLHFPVSCSDLRGRNWFRRLYRKRRLKKLFSGRSIICPSMGVLKDFGSLFDENICRKADFIYNPVDISRVSALSLNVSHSLGVQRTIFLHAGRFVHLKRHDRLLHAFKLFLEETHAEVDLVCIGDGPLLNENIKLAGVLGLQERIHFLGFLKNPFPLMASAKALILSSDFEAFGMVLVEALSLGTPCVSTNCPTGPEEILVGELSNFLTEMNPESLADGMRRVWENPPDVSGYDFSRFDPKVVAQQYIDFLQE